MWKILMFEISAKKGLRDVILGSEEKASDLAVHFSRNSGAANTVLFTIQTFNERSGTLLSGSCWLSKLNFAILLMS